MEIIFQQAKNGELTAVADNIYVHSSYNPSREAERFVANIKVTYSPSLILILEPGISYIIPLLKKTFPTSEIATIRYCKEFSKFNSGSDYVFNFFEHKDDFENYIFNSLGEEKIFGALVLQWQPSSKLFSKYENTVLLAVKSAMEKAKTLLITREFFEKKWLINSCNFIRYIKNPGIINKKINLPILIISSGPSFKDSIKIIRENRNKFFIICLSSAIKVCIGEKIIPDLCLSTDGGFWAGEHLKTLQHNNIPLALPLEGFCQKSILENNMIIPLIYNDGISKEIASKAEIPSLRAERNGTVSGTALILALSLSENDIYLTGIDMSPQKGFQHCQPNEIELNNSLKDNKLKSTERRMAISEYSEGVLPIYKQWFDFLNLKNRKVYRIIEKKYKKNTLGMIKDIKVCDFSNNILKYNSINKNNYFTEIKWKKNTKNVYSFLQENLQTEKWIKNIFPLSTASLNHNPDNTDIINRLKKEQHNLMKKIENILNEQ